MRLLASRTQPTLNKAEGPDVALERKLICHKSRYVGLPSRIILKILDKTKHGYNFEVDVTIEHISSKKYGFPWRRMSNSSGPSLLGDA